MLSHHLHNPHHILTLPSKLSCTFTFPPPYPAGCPERACDLDERTWCKAAAPCAQGLGPAADWFYCDPASGSLAPAPPPPPQSPPATPPSTPPPPALPPSCMDQLDTGLYLDGQPAGCAALAASGMCTDVVYEPAMRLKCPGSCHTVPTFLLVSTACLLACCPGHCLHLLTPFKHTQACPPSCRCAESWMLRSRSVLQSGPSHARVPSAEGRMGGKLDAAQPLRPTKGPVACASAEGRGPHGGES